MEARTNPTERGASPPNPRATWGEPWVERALAAEADALAERLDPDARRAAPLDAEMFASAASRGLALLDAARFRRLLAAQRWPRELPAAVEALAASGCAPLRRSSSLLEVASRLARARFLRARLGATRVLYRAPDTLALLAFPYPMRPGQAPRDLLRAHRPGDARRPGDGPLGYAYLADARATVPGGVPPASRSVLSEYLAHLGDLVPEGPGEWSRTPAAPWYEPPGAELLELLGPLAVPYERRGELGAGPRWDALGTPLAPLPPCPTCGGRLGAHFDEAWCADCCAWSGATPEVAP